MVRLGRLESAHFDPHDPLIDQTIAFMEAGRPTAIKGERQYLWPHFVDSETTWPLTEVFLNRDDLPRFFELVFNNLAAAIHEDFRVGCEAREGVVAVSPADAEHWRMVRDMFVREEGGYDGSEQGLFLLQAIPRSWLRPGERLSVTDMGTFFGGKINLAVMWPTTETPSPSMPNSCGSPSNQKRFASACAPATADR